MLFLFIQSSGQGWLTNENNIETNWNITFQVGPSVLLGELKKDFSGWSNDMNNVADFAFSLQMGKMVFERVDLGLEFGLLNLQGYRINPTNVHYLMRGGYFNNDSVDFQPFPLYYDSDITHLTLFAKYNFINFSSFTLGIIKLNLYAKMGIGIIWISAEMGYRDRANYQLTGLTHPIYSSGRKPRSTKNAHAIFSPAFGLNYQITERIFVSFDASFQFLSADYLDGVRNFSADLDPENTDYLPNKFRIPVYDVTGKFTLGVTYFFNFDTRKQVREKAMPWYFNRYRSYYSKYHQQSSRKARQERLPFFRDKFDDE